jgi:phenylalanyl-tRNA synthetase beta chain
MKVSTTWLNDYIAINDLTPQTLADALTNAGLEVEGGIEETGVKFKNVVVAKVVGIEAHPNADKLRLVNVEAGPKQGKTQVVCGAPNVAVGQLIAFALNGATVFSYKKNEWFTLAPAVIRSVPSEGMICSLDELALSHAYSQSDGGIWVLNDLLGDKAVGQALEKALGLDAETDAILETAPTANRGDWMSYLGVARELSALFERPLHAIHSLEKGSLDAVLSQATSPIQVQLNDKDICPYYIGASLTHVKVAPSPAWLVQRLEASGIRSINNVVDITNFVMLEMGQPLHAFDAQKLGATGVVGVRRAKDAETLHALDEVTYSLNEENIVVTFNEAPVALAGVMGGQSTCIEDSTTEVFLEAAFFPSASTRRSARQVGIRTESSARFERGIDEGGVKQAFMRALYLLETIAGATLQSACESGPYEVEPATVALPLAHLEKVIGKRYDATHVKACLNRLGFGVSVDPANDPETLEVTVPSFRQRDVQQPIDLIEEVVRIAGYNAIEATFPPSQQQVTSTLRRRILQELRHTLTGVGLNEAMTTSLVGQALLERVGTSFDESQAVKLLNSHSSEHTLMRQSVLPTLLDACLTNIQQGTPMFNAFELGRAYFKRGKSSFKNTGVQEKLMLAVILCEQEAPTSWIPSPSPDFYTLKGVLESVLDRFALRNVVTFSPNPHDAMFHPGRCASASFTTKSKAFASLGQLHPSIQKRLKLKAPVYMMEVDLDLFIKTVEQAEVSQNKGLPEVIQLSPFPEMERDLALVAEQGLSHHAIVSRLQGLAYDTLQSVDVFDEYQGSGIEAGHRSLAFRLIWQAPDRTLTDKEVDAAMSAIREDLVASLGVTLR